MILIDIVFLLGLTTGLLTAVILFYIFYYHDIKAVKEFNERQEIYKKRI